MFITSVLVIALGLVVLAFGNRLALFGAGVGALLGLGILRILPWSQDSLLWLIVPVGLAILFALGAGVTKGIVNLITVVLGALAGAAIVLGVLDLFSVDWGITNWILALVGAVIVAGLASKFEHWAIIIFAAIVGALLCVRGLQMMIPALDGWLASLIGLVLAGGGIAYHGGFFGKRKSAS